MENWAWVVMGVALAAVIASRMRQVSVPSPLMRFSGEHTPFLARFDSAGSGVFHVKVIALEFDEAGPVMYINGEFFNGHDRIEVDMIEAEVSSGDRTLFLTPFDSSTGEEPAETRIGDLIDLVQPFWLDPGQRGKFRIPLLHPESEERIYGALDRLDGAAEAMVDKLDREFGDYSLEGEFLAKIESDFLNDYVVRQIAREIGEELAWRPGGFDVTVRLLDAYEDIIERIPLRFELSRENAASLEANVNIVIVNALRMELNLAAAGYNVVVFEQ